MNISIEQVRIAFRKLKASVYFDNTMLPLRDKVVVFESASEFSTELDNIADAFGNALSDTAPIIDEIISSIVAMPFPKKVQKREAHESNVISIGSPQEAAVVEYLQYFIDMDVRGHIVGIPWILAFGQSLEDRCYSCAFGNRLRSKLIWDEESGDIKEEAVVFLNSSGGESDMGIYQTSDLISETQILKNEQP
ncbi:MAG: hypothetical protein LBU39_11895 [Desulfobulbaceae bacterium]|jgi:hypothetical protein|nr:hypothetical protein [Desulfobulbaceae bacterium]